MDSARTALAALLLIASPGWAQVESRERVEVRQLVEANVEVLVQGDATPAATQSAPKASGTRRLRLVAGGGVDADGWRLRLTDKDIDARELAFDELVSRASNDLDLRLAVQSWASDSEAGELAWAARMAVREMQRQVKPQRQLAWIKLGANGQPEIHLLRAREGSSAPATSPSQMRAQEPQEPETQPLQIATLLRNFDWNEEEIPTELTPIDAAAKIGGLYFPRQFQLPSSTRAAGGAPVQRRFELVFHPEGVVLRQIDQAQGKVTVLTFVAASVNGLVRQFPHLRKQVPGIESLANQQFGPGSRFSWGNELSMLGANAKLVIKRDAIHLQELAGSKRSAESGGSITTFMLGVKCTTLSNKDNRSHQLGPGVGLVIESREPGSVAEDLGLERGDILLELAGQPLCSFEEITRVLRERSEERIDVRFLDRAGIERVRVWDPYAPELVVEH